MNRVKDKICIVTGAALGIGRACALRLAQEGARLALFDMLDVEGEALATELRAQGFDAAYWHVDVASEARWHAPLRMSPHDLEPYTYW